MCVFAYEHRAQLSVSVVVTSDSLAVWVGVTSQLKLESQFWTEKTIYSQYLLKNIMWKTYFWFTIYFLTLFLSTSLPFWPQLIFEDSLICRMGYCAELINRVLRSLLRAELGSVTATASTAETHSQTSTGTQKQYGVRDSGLIQQTKSGIKWLFKANVASCNPPKNLNVTCFGHVVSFEWQLRGFIWNWGSF